MAILERLPFRKREKEEVDASLNLQINFNQRWHPWDERDQRMPQTEARGYWGSEADKLWKKIENSSVSMDEFKKRLYELKPKDQCKVIDLLSHTNDLNSTRTEVLGVVFADLLGYYFGEPPTDQNGVEFEERRMEFFKHSMSADSRINSNSGIVALELFFKSAVSSPQILANLEKYGVDYLRKFNPPISSVFHKQEGEVREVLKRLDIIIGNLAQPASSLNRAKSLEEIIADIQKLSPEDQQRVVEKLWPI